MQAPEPAAPGADPEEEVRLAARRQLEDELAGLMKAFERYDTQAPTALAGPIGEPRKVWNLLQIVQVALFDAEVSLRERIAVERHRARLGEERWRDALRDERKLLVDSLGVSPAFDARMQDIIDRIDRELTRLAPGPGRDRRPGQPRARGTSRHEAKP